MANAPPTRFASGVMAATPTVTYTGTAKFSKITYMTAFNVSGSAETVIVKITPNGGTVRSVARFVLDADEWAHVYSEEEPAVLAPGDSISLQTTNASGVSYYIGGEVA